MSRLRCSKCRIEPKYITNLTSRTSNSLEPRFIHQNRTSNPFEPLQKVPGPNRTHPNPPKILNFEPTIWVRSITSCRLKIAIFCWIKPSLPAFYYGRILLMVFLSSTSWPTYLKYPETSKLWKFWNCRGAYIKIFSVGTNDFTHEPY